MNLMNEIAENVSINAWVSKYLRAPFQVNKPHESDAELISLPGDSQHYLAVTIDTVSEEITSGLYRDPFTMGWVTVMASLSDLAAVGAAPLGLVIAVSVEPSRDAEFTGRIALGIEAACRTAGVFILGGDTNQAPTISLTSCAFGLVSRKKVMTRVGCRPGDLVFVSSKVGSGNAFALARLSGLSESYLAETSYRPFANLKAGEFLSRFASCCMDTSDGLLASLDQLARINGVGFEIQTDWDEILAPEAIDISRGTGIPLWTMAAGPHGEFVLTFTVAPDRQDEFYGAAERHGLKPLRIGKVIDCPGVRLRTSGDRLIDIDMAYLRNLLAVVDGDLKRFIGEFLAYGRKAGLE